MINNSRNNNTCWKLCSQFLFVCEECKFSSEHFSWPNALYCWLVIFKSWTFCFSLCRFYTCQQNCTKNGFNAKSQTFHYGPFDDGIAYDKAILRNCISVVGCFYAAPCSDTSIVFRRSDLKLADQSCTRVQILGPDPTCPHPTHGNRDPTRSDPLISQASWTRPDPTYGPSMMGKSCKAFKFVSLWQATINILMIMIPIIILNYINQSENQSEIA